MICAVRNGKIANINEGMQYSQVRAIVCHIGILQNIFSLIPHHFFDGESIEHLERDLSSQCRLDGLEP
jgi:hypothetical protein